MTSQPKLINRCDIPVRWVDLDAYGHVNNSKFFDAMTEARAMLLGKFLIVNCPYQFILVDTHCNYKRPYNYPETIVVMQYLTELGNSSFSLSYTFHSHSEPDALYAEGTAKMVCFDPKIQRATRIPDELRALLVDG